MKGSNLGLLHCRQILYQLSHQGRLYMCVSYIYVFRVHQLHLVLAICLFWLKKKDNFAFFLHSFYKKMQILLEVYFWTSQESVGTTDKHTHTKIH